MLLNILQYTGQPSATRNYKAKMSIVPRLKNPDLEVLLLPEQHNYCTPAASLASSSLNGDNSICVIICYEDYMSLI